MSVEQTPNGPRDTHAERVCLAAGLTVHNWWLEVRGLVQPDEFSHQEHRQIAGALDQLHGIGPFLPITLPDYADPSAYWPSSLTVRVHAVATLTDLNPAPIAAIARWYADGRHTEAAEVVRALAERRQQILELRYQLRDLTE